MLVYDGHSSYTSLYTVQAMMFKRYRHLFFYLILALFFSPAPSVVVAPLPHPVSVALTPTQLDFVGSTCPQACLAGSHISVGLACQDSSTAAEDSPAVTIA
jgi:hypothetical protein